MPQIRNVTPFMAAVPGLDDRTLCDVGLDADGNLVDRLDPRLSLGGRRTRLVGQLIAFLGTRGALLLQPS